MTGGSFLPNMCWASISSCNVDDDKHLYLPV
jgi:hypothetical protein